jgi:hypothetical protein
MKISFVFAVATLSSLLAMAHVEPGAHKGTGADGSACEMTAGATYFDKNTRHPLNERIEITVNGDTFVVGHPPVISVEQKSAFFDHDYFHGVLPTAKGAKALVIKMQHSDTFEGPSEFSVITHEYRNDVRSVSTCKLKE